MTNPATTTGRALHYKLHGHIHDHIPNADCYLMDDILAIEAEARTAARERVTLNGHRYVHVAACPCQPPMEPFDDALAATGTGEGTK